MADKAVAEMMSIATALRMGYSDIATIRQEVEDWWTGMSSWRRPDNRDRTFYLKEIINDLKDIDPPDLTGVPTEVLGREVCATLIVGSKSRETRLNNALARLRPSAAALLRAGYQDIGAKITRDIQKAAWKTYRIPGAYE